MRDTSFTNRLDRQLQSYRSELEPYAEILCGDSVLAESAMNHALAEARRSLRTLTTPLNSRVCFKRMLATYCHVLRNQAEEYLYSAAAA